MGKHDIRIAAAVLAAALFLRPTAVFAADGPEDPTIRVGLFYGSSALPGANLENAIGSGYRLGYYDDELEFHQLGSVEETQISVVKTQNVTFNGQNYVDGTSGSITVGCYHLQLSGSYDTFEEAQTAAEAVPDGFPAWIDGTYYVRSGAYTTREAAQAAQSGLSGSTLVGTSGYAVTVVETLTGDLLFQFDGGADRSLGIRPGLDGEEGTVTWFKGYRYYGGFRYARDGGDLTVVNIVSLEDYVKGVLPYEMSNDWPLEALKAQAVCARTYAYMNLGKHERYGFDICNTNDCQVYQGVGLSNTTTDRAVEETRGDYIWYDGELAETYYFSCDGGATESAQNIWDPNSNTPYLKGVIDPYEASVADKISQYTWSKSFTLSELTDKLNSSLSGKGYNFTGVVSVSITEVSETGNPLSIRFEDKSGRSWTFGPETIRIALDLRSNRFHLGEGSSSSTGGYPVNDGSSSLSSVEGAYVLGGDGTARKISGTPYVATGEGTERLTASSGGTSSSSGDTVTFAGSGWGHNVGMSQWGAYAMAEQGMDYIDILIFYFTGVDVG